jgi:hypothetical protein
MTLNYVWRYFLCYPQSCTVYPFIVSSILYGAPVYYALYVYYFMWRWPIIRVVLPCLVLFWLLLHIISQICIPCCRYYGITYSQRHYCISPFLRPLILIYKFLCQDFLSKYQLEQHLLKLNNTLKVSNLYVISILKLFSWVFSVTPNFELSTRSLLPSNL